ncbi:ThiF family adenylyltransferase [Sesbania bispinosa]|nr:ThiF family adenylyltransferase [Sesbania bispinosa]
MEASTNTGPCQRTWNDERLKVMAGCRIRALLFVVVWFNVGLDDGEMGERLKVIWVFPLRSD